MQLQHIDNLWMLVCAALVMLMQIGFICLEDGQVRRKNSVNVAIKNIIDFALAAGIFWLFGFGFMFAGGFSQWHLASDYFLFSSTDLGLNTVFLFQLMFAGTAATIVSGAVAERIRFSAYLILTCLVAIVVYPTFGQWVWGGALPIDGVATGWLSALGFVDFAGVSVVHATGGWVALAAVIVLGERTGRFDKKRPVMKAQNLPMSAVGVLLLWLGWFGFNGGSAFALTDATSGIIVITLIAGAMGGIANLAASQWLRGYPDIKLIFNGVLAGLVSVTGVAHAIDIKQAIIIAAIGAWHCYAGTIWLEQRKIDDVVGAVPTHAFAGTWGIIAVALFGDPKVLATGLDFSNQLAVQLLGAAACFALSFGLIWALLKLINQFYPLRIHLNAERMGLNFETHHLASEHSQLLQEIDQIKHAGNGHKAKLNIDPLSDMAELAAQYNVLLREANLARKQVIKANNSLEQKVLLRTQELTLARNQAQAAAQAKTNFLATMSHEIRTPMNGVMGMVELLQQTDLNQEKGELAQVVAESGSTLLHIINDILDYSKIEAGQLEVENIAFNIASEISTVNKLMQPKAQYKGLSLSVDIALGLPSVLLGDPNRLRQILFNLVGNAIKFTHTGHITINVTPSPCELTHENTASCIRIEVVDTGIGLTEEIQHTLFMPFSQADSSTTRIFGGTGLGLSICSQLVELMGGSIGVHSKLNLGSTFWLELPLQEAPIAAQHAAALSPPSIEANTQAFEPPSDAVANANNIMILIAEDNPVNLRVMQKMLYRLGYASTAVKDGQAAWQAVNEGMFGLLLTDCHMPELDGYQLTQKIRQHLNSEQLPIVAVTASVLAKDAQKARDVGMDDFLTKPITLAALDAVVQTYLPKATEFRQIQTDAPPQQAILDEHRLSQLLGDDLAVKQEMLQLFVDSTQTLVDQLQTSIEQNDEAALKQAAHSISGAAGVTGAMALSRICSTIEKAVSEQKLDLAWHHAQQVNASFEQLKQTIQQQQATQSDPVIPPD